MWWHTRRQDQSTQPAICCRSPAASPSTFWTPCPSSGGCRQCWGNLSLMKTRTLWISSHATLSTLPKQVNVISATRGGLMFQDWTRTCYSCFVTQCLMLTTFWLHFEFVTIFFSAQCLKTSHADWVDLHLKDLRYIWKCVIRSTLHC